MLKMSLIMIRDPRNTYYFEVYSLHTESLASVSLNPTSFSARHLYMPDILVVASLMINFKLSPSSIIVYSLRLEVISASSWNLFQVYGLFRRRFIAEASN